MKVTATARRGLPFRIERQSCKTLTDQVAEGLRHAIITGHFKPGDRLPTKLEMAAELGVNDITIRRALAQLKQEGFVAPKPRRGILVCDRARHSWRGHVLFCAWSGPDMYYHTVQAAEITRRLHAQRYLVTDLHLNAASHMNRYAELRAILETRSVDLVLAEGGQGITFGGSGPSLLDVLADFRAPYICLDDATSATARNRQADIVLSVIHAYRALAHHCRQCGIRTVGIAVMRAPGDPISQRVAMLAAALRATGVQCAWLDVQQPSGFRNPEATERGGLSAMQTWLAEKHDRPDLFYFSDDFIARGALLALVQHGIRIPEDVQVATWANRGLGPVFSKPLTRIEMDPVAHGVIVADVVLSVLEGWNGKTPVVLEPEFIVGETTRKRKN